METLDETWLKTVRNGKAKMADLKSRLKSVGLPQSGDAIDLANRIMMYADVSSLGLQVELDGLQLTPFQLSPSQLRKALALRELSPIGNKDELWKRLIDCLKEANPSNKAFSTSQKSSLLTHDKTGEIGEAIQLAKKIIALKDEYTSILSSLGDEIRETSSTSEIRKAYFKISLKIHPDKLQRDFPDATKAFQYLVTAYERVSQPELYDESPEQKKSETKAFMRSNEDCYRTKINCPRCKVEWGLPVSGVEKYDYNLIMTAIKTYNCCSCLLDFGCMTALHHCPHCNSTFDYHPNDYHRQILCSNAKCKKKFGFYMYYMSDRKRNELRKELRALQEERVKAKDAISRREKRAALRYKTKNSTELQKETEEDQQQEKSFLIGLIDTCPRCGNDEAESQEDRENHLKHCNDMKIIKAYQQQVRLMKKRKAEVNAARQNEENVQALKTWEYLGSETGMLWTLGEPELRKLCEQYELSTLGTREELLQRVAQYRNKLDASNLLTDGETTGSAKKTKFNEQLLPSNLHSMTYEQLKAVCAVNGIPTKATTKTGIIRAIEKKIHDGDQSFQLEN